MRPAAADVDSPTSKTTLSHQKARPGWRAFFFRPQQRLRTAYRFKYGIFPAGRIPGGLSAPARAAVPSIYKHQKQEVFV